MVELEMCPATVASKLVVSVQRESMRRSTTMAEVQRMTAADVVAKVMAGEHGDFVREAVAVVARELMEAEISVELAPSLARSPRPA